MYLLDTNVVSELRKVRERKGHPAVAAWVETVADEQLFISAITIRELCYGVLLIERKDQTQGRLLRQWLETSVLPGFAGRILPVTTGIALRCAELHIPNPRPEMDALIAATALVHDMTIVTRNTRDFAGTGVRLVDPWAH